MDITKNASDIPPPTESVSIISLTDLMNTLDVIKSKEQEDRDKVKTIIVNISDAGLRERLITWGALGFPDAYELFSVQLSKHRCSDGVFRNNLVDYYSFLFPDTTLQDLVSKVQARLSEMTLSYSYTDDYLLKIHVQKNLTN